MKKRKVLTLGVYKTLQKSLWPPVSEENCITNTGQNKMNSGMSKPEIKYCKRQKSCVASTKGINWEIIKIIKILPGPIQRRTCKKQFFQAPFFLYITTKFFRWGQPYLKRNKKNISNYTVCSLTARWEVHEVVNFAWKPKLLSAIMITR